jgi:hypothetical protein
MRSHKPWACACRAAPATRATGWASHAPHPLRLGCGRLLGSRRVWPLRDDEDSGESEGRCLGKKHSIERGLTTTGRRR